MDLIKFVPESLFIVVGVLWFIGAMIKQANFIKDEYIPFILTAIGICFAVFMQGFNVNAVLEGIVCASVSIYGNNVAKQAMKLIQEKQ